MTAVPCASSFFCLRVVFIVCMGRGLQIGVQDVMFLPSQAFFPTRFLSGCGGGFLVWLGCGRRSGLQKGKQVSEEAGCSVRGRLQKKKQVAEEEAG